MKARLDNLDGTDERSRRLADHLSNFWEVPNVDRVRERA